MPWASSLSLQAWDGINQCERLLRVVTIGSGQLNGERNSPCVADQMTFAAQRGRSVGFGPVCRPQKLPGSNCRPRRPATNQSPRSVPASPATRSGSVARCLLPVTYPSPAAHARTAAQFLRQHLPWYSAAKDEQNSHETSTVWQTRCASLGSAR